MCRPKVKNNYLHLLARTSHRISREEYSSRITQESELRVDQVVRTSSTISNSEFSGIHQLKFLLSENLERDHVILWRLFKWIDQKVKVFIEAKSKTGRCKRDQSQTARSLDWLYHLKKTSFKGWLGTYVRRILSKFLDKTGWVRSNKANIREKKELRSYTPEYLKSHIIFFRIHSYANPIRTHQSEASKSHS